MTKAEFAALLRPIVDACGERELDAGLEADLNQRFAGDSAPFAGIEAACQAAIDAGWMCKHEAGGIRYGRVLRADAELAPFSVDVVHMHNVRGPRHRHPHGEIDMVMPLDADARFDGNGRGWCVYPPGSVHSPTVTAGAALVLYLLPDGAIEFTDQN